jgi:hypothetical protein
MPLSEEGPSRLQDGGITRRLRAAILGLLALLPLSCGCGLFTDYDFDRPDTPANREGFEHHFGFPVPASVSDLYYFADELGADVQYQLGFSTDPETVERIVAALDLTEGAPPVDCTGLVRTFDWWTEDAVVGLTPYWTGDEDRDYYRCLWFDPDSRRAYYIAFSL